MRAYLDGEDLSDLESVAREDFRSDLEGMQEQLDRRLSERLLSQIHRRAGIGRKAFRGTFNIYRRIAAAAVAVIVLSTAWYLVAHRQVKQLAIHTVSERKKVALPDGSLVFLEKGSSISYPENFGKASRRITLSGEAFFDVKSDASHPFVISSALINTTVLGTSFNMEVRDGKAARVVVVSGMVQVNTSASQHPLVLTANKGVVLHPGSQQLQLLDGTDDARFFEQRRNGRFIYKGQPVAQVLNDLQRYYNVPVKVSAKTGQCGFYGDFSTNDDLNKVLTLIAVTLNARIEEESKGNGYTIVGGNCQ